MLLNQKDFILNFLSYRFSSSYPSLFIFFFYHQQIFWEGSHPELFFQAALRTFPSIITASFSKPLDYRGTSVSLRVHLNHAQLYPVIPPPHHYWPAPLHDNQLQLFLERVHSVREGFFRNSVYSHLPLNMCENSQHYIRRWNKSCCRHRQKLEVHPSPKTQLNAWSVFCFFIETQRNELINRIWMTLEISRIKCCQS